MCHVESHYRTACLCRSQPPSAVTPPHSMSVQVTTSQCTHTTAQHVCTGHNLPVQHDTTNMSQYDNFQRSTEITIKCCTEMLHESGGLSHNEGQNINMPLNIISGKQNYSPTYQFSICTRMIFLS